MSAPKKRWHQCPAMYVKGNYGVFCTKEEGHEGDHRGYRRQWNANGEAVPVTEKEVRK